MAVALLPALAPSVAFAATTPPLVKHALQIPAGAPVQAAKAGFLPGSAGVSPSGAFTYQVLFAVPDGRAGMAPSLGLSYSSAGGDGPLGLGWSLSGAGSSITRCGKTPDTEGTRSGVHYDKNDRFCLDGQKLIGIGASESGGTGDYGDDKTEYRTEFNGLAKIVSTNAGGNLDTGPDTFTVAGKDGRIRTYTSQIAVRTDEGVKLHEETSADGPLNCPFGESENPNLCYPSKRTWTDTATVQQESAGQSTPRAVWQLSSEKDRSGNEVRYEYANTADATGNEFLLKKIRYTYGTGGKDAARYVQFNYDPRPDTSFSYVNGVRYVSTQRLKSIGMYAPNPGATSLVRQYNLGYEPIGAGAGQRSRSMLNQVQECGAQGGCLPAKKFTWSASQAPSFATTSLGSLPLNTKADAGMPPNAHVQDLDGDGTDDLLFTPGADTFTDNVTARLGTRSASGVPSPLSQSNTVTGGLPGQAWPSTADLRDGRAVDIDGDGRVEFAVATHVPGGSVKILRWDASASKFTDTGMSLQLGTKLSNTSSPFFDFADVNGDGLPDFITGAIQGTDPDPDAVKVRLNQGGTFGSPVTTLHTGGWSGQCPSRVTDNDGDGRADILVDSKVASGMIDFRSTWTHQDPKVISCGLNQGTAMLQVDDTGKITANSSTTGGQHFPPLSPMRGDRVDHVSTSMLAGQPIPVVWTDPDSVHDEPRPNALYGAKTFLGDFNGDGLRDTLLLPSPGTDQFSDLGTSKPGRVLWNTGRGLHWDGTTVAIPRDVEADLRIADMNGDGRDDIVSFYNFALSAADQEADGLFESVTTSGNDGMAVLLAQKDGGFEKNTLPGGTTSGIALPKVGRAFSQLGDFNGDGRMDIVKDDGALKVMTQEVSSPDRITAVRDENAVWDRESVTYSNDWSARPEAMLADQCDAPLVCVRRGMTVVRQVTSRNAAYTASDPGHTVYYTYGDPVAHVRQGFLGFGTVRSWDPARGAETVTTYDKHTGYNFGRYYPFASMPKTVTTTVPVLKSSELEWQPLTAKARVTRTTSTPEFRALAGDRFAVFPNTSTTLTWEDDNVSLDWDTSLSGSGHSTHIRGIDDPVAGQAKRQTDTDADYDGYGNVSKQRTVTTGGSTREVVTHYDLAPQRILDGLTGLADQVTTTSWEPGADTSDPSKGVIQHVDNHFDDLGRLDSVTTEKGNTDAALTGKTSYTLDAAGVPTATTIHADGVPDQVSHAEYTPVFTGQPDEEIYASQVWSEHDVAANRPSSWRAVHPAFGVSVATEDINGVNTSTLIDDLGRPVQNNTDLGRSTTLAYIGSFDGGGGRIGTQVTATTGNAKTKTLTDSAGRTREVSSTGFDGTTTVTSTGYDLLGRAISQTRPNFSTSTPPKTSTAYDTLDRPIDTTLPNNHHQTVDYTFGVTTDAVKTTDARNIVTIAYTDVDGRPVKNSRAYKDKNGVAKDAVTTYTYARLASTVTDDAGNAVQTDYDILGRPVKTVDPDRGTTSTSYYGTGQTDTVTHQDTNNTSHFGYDDLGRLTSRTDYDKDANRTDTTSYTFDTAQNGIGQPATAVSPDGITTAFRYDDLGRPAGTDYTDAADPNTTYSTNTGYDPVTGLPATLTYPSSGGQRLKVKNIYNSYDNWTDVQDITTGTAKTLWHTATRNADQAMTAASIGTTGSVTLTRGYDPDTGQLTGITAKNQANTKLQDVTYTYGPSGLVDTRTQNDSTTPNRAEKFGYNEFNRLTSWDLTNNTSPTVTTTYGFDTIGNLKTVTRGTQTDTRTYGYTDDRPQPLPHALTGHVGSLPGTGTETLQYDGQGRQKTVKDETGATTRTTTYTAFDLPKTIKDKNNKTTNFAYDAYGTRVKKRTPDGAVTFTIPGLFEKRSDAAGHATYIHYLTGPDGPIGQAVTQNNTTTIDYTLTDAQGSTSTTTNATGTTATTNNTFYYDPYGNRTTNTGAPTTNPNPTHTHGYTGHEMDDDLGLINMNGRIYAPNQYTFLTPDPITSNHPYTYVNSNPTNYTDPTGYDGDCFACANDVDTTNSSYYPQFTLPTHSAEPDITPTVINESSTQNDNFGTRTCLPATPCVTGETGTDETGTS
ncbi:FG-GAP-like repeat-containing protein, partial [Streptomyces sp. NPDC057909]|uniref:FG-GAP-like repeat-containing protein n=1 Tax=Streptomyces sp. NPDC057909 TaxID=3346277 RepID=UPI0036E3C2C9